MTRRATELGARRSASEIDSDGLSYQSFAQRDPQPSPQLPIEKGFAPPVSLPEFGRPHHPAAILPCGGDGLAGKRKGDKPHY